MAHDQVSERERSGGPLPLSIPSWEQLSAGVVDFSSFDVALLNLIAAQGLPGSENIDVPKLLDRLDDWADRVKLETARHMYRFGWMSQQPQSDFTVGNSLARFCCYYLFSKRSKKTAAFGTTPNASSIPTSARYPTFSFTAS